jgi:hypothetical protein
MDPRASSVPGASGASEEASDGPPRPLLARLRGPWRIAVTDESMQPTLEPGDWLLADPTVRRWPRPGSLVCFREPGSGLLVVKRVAARGPVTVASPFGPYPIEPDEAWLESDNPIGRDSRHYGPVRAERLVARVRLRYGPPGRAGRLDERPRPPTGRAAGDA